MVSLPSGDWGLGARAESLRGILLRRKSGKGESREVTGNHRTQQIWRPPSCFTYTPRYNNPVEAGVPGRQKGSVKPKPVSLLKEKSHCQCIFLPQVLSWLLGPIRHSRNACPWVGKNLQGWFWPDTENPRRKHLRQMHKAEKAEDSSKTTSLQNSRVSNCRRRNYFDLPDAQSAVNT